MHPVVYQSSQLILAGDIAGAEQALVSIAEDEGDHALVRVLDEIAPKDLLSIMREFDASHESVVNMLVTPEQFARAIVLESKFGERTSERLRALVNTVLYREPALAADYLEAMSTEEGGSQTLADYFEDRFDEILHFMHTGTFSTHFDHDDTPKPHNAWQMENIDDHDQGLEMGNSMEDEQPRLARGEVADGDWMETSWLLRYELPEAFEDVLFVLRNRAQKLALAASLAAAAPVPEAPAATADDDESAI